MPAHGPHHRRRTWPASRPPCASPARGVAVIVHEATDRAGGRCRSYDDAATAMRIDNGTHILLSGNTAALGFLPRHRGVHAGARRAVGALPFVDLATGERWTLDLGAGRLPLGCSIRGAAGAGHRRGRLSGAGAPDVAGRADKPLAAVMRLQRRRPMSA